MNCIVIEKKFVVCSEQAARRNARANVILGPCTVVFGVALARRCARVIVRKKNRRSHIESGTYGEREDARRLPASSVSSRFLTEDRPLDEAELALLEDIRGKAAALEAQITRVKSGRYRHLAMVALEESVLL